MRTPLRTKGLRQQHAKPVTMPAPVGGWNARDSLADMPPEDAIELVNMFPDTSTCRVRGGAINPRVVGPYPWTLMTYAPLNGSPQVFACDKNGIWRVKQAAPFNALDPCDIFDPPGNIVNPTATNRYQWTMFGDGTNEYLIMVSGKIAPIYYWGETYAPSGRPLFRLIDSTTSPALSGVDVTTLNFVNVHKGRLFFLQNNSLKFWYLAAGAAGGALSSFDLSAEAKKGGYLVAMANWTRDAGDGQDDVAVFLTSQGEAIVYQGNNPASASNWAKVGTFFIGRPLGPRCTLQFGADLLVLTENGIFPISTALRSGTVERQYAISFKIDKAFTRAAQLYGQNFGWRMIHFPRENALIVNVPIREGREHEQYVMNTITKAWCRFTGWNAADFAVSNDRLYLCMQWGTSGYVLDAWAGGHDYTSIDEYYANAPTGRSLLREINWKGRQAFTYLGNAQQKAGFMLRPVVEVPGHLTYLASLDTDFQERSPTSVTTYRTSQAVWGEGIWGVSTWPVEPETATQMVSANAYPGVTVSVHIEGDYTDQPDATSATNGIQTTATEVNTVPNIKWIATDIVASAGGVL